MPIGQTAVPSATFQALQSNPDRIDSAVRAAASQAAGGNPVEEQQLIAAWHNAIASCQGMRSLS